MSVLPWGLYSRAMPRGSASSLPGPGQHRQGNGLDECEPPVPGATVTLSQLLTPTRSSSINPGRPLQCHSQACRRDPAVATPAFPWGSRPSG